MVIVSAVHHRCWLFSLRWRHNDHAGVSNHQPHGCLLNRLFRRKSKKTSKLRVTGLLCGKFTGDRWISRTNGQLRGKCFHLMTSSCATLLPVLWEDTCLSQYSLHITEDGCFVTQCFLSSWDDVYIYHVAHYSNGIMDAMTSQITGLTIVYSTVYSGTDQRKHQSSASLAFVRGIPHTNGQ